MWGNGSGREEVTQACGKNEWNRKQTKTNHFIFIASPSKWTEKEKNPPTLTRQSTDRPTHMLGQLNITHSVGSWQSVLHPL